MNTQNLFTEKDYDEMFNLMVKHQKIKIHFTKVTSEDDADTNENYGSATYGEDGYATYGDSVKPCYLNGHNRQ